MSDQKTLSIIQRFSSESIVNIEKIAKGEFNEIYRIATKKGDLILKKCY